MIVYSVTVTVSEKIHQEWKKWMLDTHIPEVMDCGLFTAYRMLKVIQHVNPEEGHSYNIQYDCPSMKALQEYQSKYATKLQAEHSKKFENEFAAFRTLLEKVGSEES